MVSLVVICFVSETDIGATIERILMRIEPPTPGEQIAMTMTNDNAPIADASTLVARLEEHSDFAHKVVRDLLREASERIQFLTKERDYYEMKMTFYAKDAERDARMQLYLSKEAMHVSECPPRE
jgi:hypothetical protein